MFQDNTDARRFEWREAGQIAFADYRDRDGVRFIPHVEAAPALRGTGAAGRLMAAIVKSAREEGAKLHPTCGYAVAWFRRHPDAGDVLA